jgi:transposase-like protein
MRRKNEAIDEERGRWSSRKKMAAVMRLLKGEDLDALSRELKVNAATLSSWREVFLASGLSGLKSREVDGRDEKITQLQKALGETALNLEISREINRVYERKHGPLAPGKSNK